MKPHQEDPRLTAYALGELPSGEAAALESALAADPALKAAYEETAHFRDTIAEALGGEHERLLPRQRDAIRRAAKEAARKGRVESLPSHRTARRNWAAPLAAAAVIIGGVFLLTLIPTGKGGSGGKKVAGNSDPDKGRVAEAGVAVAAGEGKVLRIPLNAGGKSLARITDAVRGERRLPAIEEVSIPELLNSFPLKAAGTASLWDGCKLGAEILPSPWKPSASLVFVEVQGAKDGARELSVEYRAEEGAVIAHRLLGYEVAETSGGGHAVSRLAANSRSLLMIEVQSRDARLGSLHWFVGGKEAPPVPLTQDPEKEPSDDSRFATLICAFGLWLRGEGGGIDDSLVLGLAREVASGSLVADRYDFLNLVDEAVKLAGK